MLNAALFIATVLIWGSTWIAIAFQIGPAPVTVSIFYRFALAAVIMLAALAALGRLKRPAVWRYVGLQALCLFCFNFICFCNATAWIPSGLVAVVFSLASIMNAFAARVIFKDALTMRTLTAGAIGVVGVLLLFLDDLAVALDHATLRGLGWATLRTMFFSMGNMASRLNSRHGVTPVTANAWGMGIGAGVLLGIVAATGQPLEAPDGARYWAALVYLAVFGSIIAFTAYLMLVARIGSAKAAYATVLFPVVALSISTVFEGYEWSLTAAIGVALTLAGNIVMFARRPRRI